MATEIMKSFDALQEELERAKDNLRGVDEHIKKLIGRDPSESQQRPGVKRPFNQTEEFRGRGRGISLVSRGRRDLGGRQEDEEESPAPKRRPGDPRTVFSRLSGPPRSQRGGDSGDEDELPNKPVISSRVIATPKELPSRQEALAAQNADEKSKARNKRMFGALLGTLQRFRQEETRMKDKEEKRAQVEKKLEENAKREKEELKKERQELFLERKRKQAEIKKIELKMLRIKEQDEWEAKYRHLLNFIQTRTKPHIFYLPKSHNGKTEERLIASQKLVAKMIEKKRQEVRQELEAIEKRGRWRQGLSTTEITAEKEPEQSEEEDDHPEENEVQEEGGEDDLEIKLEFVSVGAEAGKESEVAIVKTEQTDDESGKEKNKEKDSLSREEGEAEHSSASSDDEHKDDNVKSTDPIDPKPENSDSSRESE